MQRAKIITWANFLAEVCGAWWSLMSGALSIPFAIIALFVQGHPRRLFALLAFIAVWVFGLKAARKNYHLMKKAVIKPLQIESVPLKGPFDVMQSNCEVLITNNNQPVSDFGLRLLSIEPHFKPRTAGVSTQKVSWPSIRFSPKDIPGNMLKSGQFATFDIFKVKRGAFEVVLEICGELPDDRQWLNDFVPEIKSHIGMNPVFQEHVVTFETSAVGVPTQATRFRLLFSTDRSKPLFTLERSEPG